MVKLKSVGCLILTLSLLSLSGCGTEKDNTQTTIEVFNNKSENQQIMKTFIKEYEELNPNVKVVFSSPQDAGTVLRTRLVKNDIPNIISFGGDITYTELADVGMLEDLSNETFIENIVPAYKDMTVD